MTNKELFKIWTSPNNIWTNWVRPTPFVSITNKLLSIPITFNLPPIIYVNELTNIKNTAIIVDLPNIESVEEGIALSKLGFIPIPIYNGTIEQKNAIATVDNTSIQIGLLQGAYKLKDCKNLDTASPAFLLDSNRTNRFKMNISIFDNSWDIYPQDLPSADFLIKKGISKIIVKCVSVQNDLNKILYTFQEKGLKIFCTDGYDIPYEIIIKKKNKGK